MNNNRVGTLFLEGQDAINFATSIFYHSYESIVAHAERIRNLNNTITIKRALNGFSADILDLDLSFLDKKTDTEQLAITIKVTVRAKDVSFISNDNDIKRAKIQPVSTMSYSSCDVTDSLYIAA